MRAEDQKQEYHLIASLWYIYTTPTSWVPAYTAKNRKRETRKTEVIAMWMDLLHGKCNAKLALVHQNTCSRTLQCHAFSYSLLIYAWVCCSLDNNCWDAVNVCCIHFIMLDWWTSATDSRRCEWTAATCKAEWSYNSTQSYARTLWNSWQVYERCKG